MPKTRQPRMQGWRGKSYDELAWETEPRTSYIISKMREVSARPGVVVDQRPSIDLSAEARRTSQARLHDGKYSKGSKK